MIILDALSSKDYFSSRRFFKLDNDSGGVRKELKIIPDRKKFTPYSQIFGNICFSICLTVSRKALLPQLTNVIENQKILEAELDLIRTLIQRSDISIHPKEIEGEKIERDPSATDKKQSIIKQFNNLKSYIEEKDDPKPVIECLENIKEDIFVFTGGHRILYEIAQFSNRLNGMETLTNGVRENLKEKIIFWINKLSVKG